MPDPDLGQLKLPKNWWDYSAGALAGCICDQLPDVPDQPPEPSPDLASGWSPDQYPEAPEPGDLTGRRLAARHFTAAAIDLTLATRWQPLRPDLVLSQPASNVWTIGDVAIAYFPALDAKTIECALRYTVRWIGLQVVMPAKGASALRLAMDSFVGRLTPVILSVDDFINLAVSAAAVDAQIAYRKAVLRLLTNYNRRAAEIPNPPSPRNPQRPRNMLIDMPEE